jgi:N-formylglutamate amidohydrolase
MSRYLFLLALPLALFGLLPATSAAPAESKPEDFVTVQKGTLPIIISAPHGGRKSVPDVPERKGVGVKNFAVVLDTNTAELTEKFVAELEKRLDGKPWVVIARFERKYLDVNRSRDQSYESEKAKPYYDAYHGPLEEACKAVKEKFGRGILLDIHGQGEFPGSIVRGTQNGKTVTLLKDRYGVNALTGKKSILGFLDHHGYKILPSCDADPKTKEESRYLFSGGYIVGNYGSHTGYAIDAIQLEFGSYLREKDKDKYAKTAADLAEAVAVFHDEYLKDAKPQ